MQKNNKPNSYQKMSNVMLQGGREYPRIVTPDFSLSFLFHLSTSIASGWRAGGWALHQMQAFAIVHTYNIIHLKTSNNTTTIERNYVDQRNQVPHSLSFWSSCKTLPQKMRRCCSISRSRVSLIFSLSCCTVDWKCIEFIKYFKHVNKVAQKCNSLQIKNVELYFAFSVRLDVRVPFVLTRRVIRKVTRPIALWNVYLYR